MARQADDPDSARPDGAGIDPAHQPSADTLLKWLGGVAEAAGLAVLILNAGTVLVWSLGFVGLVVASYIVWNRWRQPLDLATLGAFVIGVVGAGVFGFGLADQLRDEAEPEVTTAAPTSDDAAGDSADGSTASSASTTASSSTPTTASTTTTTLAAEPQITIAPDQKLEEQDVVVTVSGSGFGPGERIRINISETDGDDSCAPVLLACEVLREVEASESGEFNAVQVTVHGNHIAGFAGTYYVNAMGMSTNRVASFPFRVVETA